ncbi:hypothetical protein ACFSNO_33625 [Streptomyces cirratus]
MAATVLLTQEAHLGRTAVEQERAAGVRVLAVDTLGLEGDATDRGSRSARTP